jgi:anthranilate synthase component 1
VPAADPQQLQESPTGEYAPFTGGLVGYFAYDYLNYSEPTTKREVRDTEAFQDVDLMLFDKVICYDHFRQKILLIVNVPLVDVETEYNRAVMELETLRRLIMTGEKKRRARRPYDREVRAMFDRESYCAMVEKAKRYIREGIFFRSFFPTGWRRPLKAACSIPTGFCAR